MTTTIEMIPELQGLKGASREVAREAIRRGLRIEKIGRVWHVRGPGVDIRAISLGYINRVELLPGRYD